MFGIHLRQLGTTAASIAALMTIALLPGTAFAQRTITIVIPEEPDSLDNCNSARSAVGRVISQNVNETLIELDPNDSSLKPRLATLRAACERLNDMRLDALELTGPGTDLRIGLLPSSRWVAGDDVTVDGIRYVRNLPTEEIFTTPDRRRTEEQLRESLAELKKNRSRKRKSDK